MFVCSVYLSSEKASSGKSVKGAEPETYWPLLPFSSMFPLQPFNMKQCLNSSSTSLKWHNHSKDTEVLSVLCRNVHMQFINQDVHVLNHTIHWKAVLHVPKSRCEQIWRQPKQRFSVTLHELYTYFACLQILEMSASCLQMCQMHVAWVCACSCAHCMWVQNLHSVHLQMDSMSMGFLLDL